MKYVSTEVVERWLLGAHKVKVDHCGSCHEEWDSGYVDPGEFDLGKDRHTMACCGMREALRRVKE